MIGPRSGLPTFAPRPHRTGLRRGPWVAAAIAAVVALSLCLAATETNAASPAARYQIAARLDLTQGTIEAEQTVTVPNRTGQSLDRLVFQAEAAHFGGFSLAAEVNGVAVQPQVRDMAIDLPLATPLAPGAEATVRFSFGAQPPRQEGRYGLRDGIAVPRRLVPAAGGVPRAPAGTGRPRRLAPQPLPHLWRSLLQRRRRLRRGPHA